ncbi:MAG TPA: 1-phosphofructokinase family hexose kinase [Candidatus Hydrogenedentes bacterium]|nr:1-phosphofructokinase family hexose kinase [Candidatus Hydrogenedentota bacterium]
MTDRHAQPGPVVTITPNPCVDKTLFIDVPLRPGRKIRGTKWSCVAGGKGCNVSRAVRAMGGQTRAIIVAGGLTGEHVRHMLETEDGVPCVTIPVAGWTRTITTVLETGRHRQTALFEPGPSVTPEEARHAIDVARREIARAGVVTLNGSTPCPTLDDLYAEAIRAAARRRIPVILDAYGEVFRRALPEGPWMVKPNREEAEAFLGYPLETSDDYAKAADTFHRLGVRIVVISEGRRGAYFSDGYRRFRAKPPRVREVNPVGSGDAMVAAMALCLGGYAPLPGMAISTADGAADLELLARLGTAAGAANAMTWDIGHFDTEQIARLAEKVVILSS